MSVKHNIINSTGIKRRYFLLGTGSAIASTVIASCSSTSSQNPPSQQISKVKIGVATVVTEDILKFIQKNLAPSQNLDIELVKITDWVQINNALSSGEIDANFFQHQAYMEDAAKNLKLDLVILNRSYISVFGLYSKKLKIKSVNEVPVGATVVVHSDPINRDRGLKLLRDNGLINLKDNPSGLFTIKDAIDHPKKLQIKEVDGPAVVRSLDDVDLGVTYVTLLKLAKLDLTPIVQAPTNDRKYATGLVTLRSKENEPKIQKLNQIFIDPKVRDFIKTSFPGSIVPVF